MATYFIQYRAYCVRRYSPTFELREIISYLESSR